MGEYKRILLGILSSSGMWMYEWCSMYHVLCRVSKGRLKVTRYRR